MRTHLNHRLAAAAIVPVLALGLTACNDDDKKDDGKASETPSQTVTDAAEESPAAEEESDAPAGGDATEEFVDLVSAGLEASTTAKVSMEITASGMQTTASGEIDYTGDQPATSLQMTMPGGMGEAQIVMVDNVMYMSIPAMGQQGWFKIDLADLQGNDQLGLGSLGSLDLRDTMKTFTEGVESVEKVGTEDVDGVAATHYRVTADTAAMAGMLGDQAAQAEIPDNLVYDVWLDEQGRFTRMTADLDKNGAMEMTVTDWGTEVDIKAPPANQVQEFPTSMLGAS